MLRATLSFSVLVTALAAFAGEVASRARGERSIVIPAMNGTLVSFMNESPSLSLATRLVRQHFREVQDAVSIEGESHRQQVECAHGPQGFIETIFHIDWGDMRSRHLNHIGDFSHPEFTQPSRIFAITRSLAEITKLRARQWVQSYRLQWKEMYLPMLHTFSPDRNLDPYRICSVTAVTAIYNLGAVAVIFPLTNLTNSDGAMWRGHSCESIGEKEGRLEPLREMYQGFAENNVQDGDAILTVQKMTRTWTPNRGNRNQDFASTLNASEYGTVEKVKLQESDSLSIVALLLLPAILPLFPLALFQEAGLRTTLVYSVAPDIFSVLPLAVKGIELVIHGSRKHFAHVTDVSGMQDLNKTHQYANTWVSMCEMRPFVRQRGVSYLAGAAAIMMLGISLEFLFKGILSREVKARKWYGPVILREEKLMKSFLMLP